MSTTKPTLAEALADINCRYDPQRHVLVIEPAPERSVAVPADAWRAYKMGESAHP